MWTSRTSISMCSSRARTNVTPASSAPSVVRGARQGGRDAPEDGRDFIDHVEVLFQEQISWFLAAVEQVSCWAGSVSDIG